MAMNAAKIAQELATLEARNKTCAEQLRELYQRYLEALSNTASQQLMSVCYQLCTESYPDAFLGLPPQKRKVLQEKVRGQRDKLRQQLSLEGLLRPDPGDVEEAKQPRIAVIKAELTGDDLEVITSALDEDNSDRILALLQDKKIDLPFDLEAVMKQRQKLKGKPESSAPAENNNESEADSRQLSASDSTQPSETEEGNSDTENDSSAQTVEPSLDVQATPSEPSPSSSPVEIEGYSSVSSAKTGESIAAPNSERSLGRRFLEDILSGRALERRLGNEDGASMSGEGSLQVETPRGNTPVEPPQAETSAAAADNSEPPTASTADDADEAAPNAFEDNNGFDPNFEPPPAEDRYEPTPLKSSSKLDISPGVLASTLAAEGEDDRGGMLMRPIPYDGTTKLSDEALRDPLVLIRWVERMERGISQRLRQSSQRMTRTLEKCQILNNELPDGLLEAAVRPDGDHEDDSDSNMPHVLSLRLNAAGKDNRPRRDKSIRIVAIYLRLSEIEFTTPAVMAWRNQLRSQVKQLKQLAKEYQDCKHAQSVVEAQELWRNGWEQD